MLLKLLLILAHESGNAEAALLPADAGILYLHPGSELIIPLPLPCLCYLPSFPHQCGFSFILPLQVIAAFLSSVFPTL